LGFEEDQVNNDRQRATARNARPAAPAMYEGRPLANPDEDIYDQGLAFDVETLLDRRRMLKLIGFSGLSAGLFALVGCGPAGSGTGAPASASAAGTLATASAGATAAQCAVIAEETAGPFPGDGSNGANVLTESGIVRSDITKSFGSGSATAAGVPLTITLKVLDIKNGAAPLAGAAVYLWHCDREGRYSLYSQGVTSENYLRGVQEADADGVVTYTSIYPAAYPGRWPHVHFEVYPSLAKAAAAADKLRTSQLALPEDTSKLVYATTGYEASVQNLAQTPLARDMVFSDGYSLQLATMSGDVAQGLTATLNVPV
jgi:protocatechuate 3,4-dioxygenase beta subunit